LAAPRGMGSTTHRRGRWTRSSDHGCSSAAFVAAIDQAGIVTQSPSALHPGVEAVQVRIGDSTGELRPFAGGFRAEGESTSQPRDRRQSFTFDLSPEGFSPDIARARTLAA